MAKLPSKEATTTISAASTIVIDGKRYHLRPFTGAEEKIILTAKMKNDEKVFMDASFDVIDACTGIESRELPMGAIQLLMMELRAISVSAEAPVTFLCEHCGHEHPVKIPLHAFDIPQTFTNTLEIDSLYDKTPVKMVLKTPVSQAFIDSRDMPEDNEIYLVFKAIEQVYVGDDLIDEPFTFEEFKDFLLALTDGAYSKAVAFAITFPSITFKRSFQCQACKKESKIEVAKPEDFFR